MIYTCPFCRTLFEMGDDHQAEPCSRCYREGHRIDSAGNRSRQTPSPYDLSGNPSKEYPGE